MTPLRLLLFWFVAAALLLLPGALLARRSRLLWDRLGPGERVLPSFLLSAGIAGLVYLLALAIRPTLEFAVGLWIALTLLLAVMDLAAVLRRRASSGSRSDRTGPGADLLAPPGGRSGSLWAAPVILFAALAMLYEGGSLGFMHDSLDFVAYVQRMLLSGRIDLASGAFADVADLASDPRRGVFHLVGAVLCRLTGAPAAAMWRHLPVVLAPLALWVVFVALRRLLSSAPSALAGLFFLVAGTFFTGQNWINNLAYASRIGWIYGFVGLWAVALWLDGVNGARRHALGLALAAAPILLGIHVLSAAQYLVSLGACAWGWALLRETDRRTRRTLIALPFAALGVLLPFLALKLAESYSTANPLFDHAQGLLYLWGNWAVLAPRHLWAWYGPLGALGILLTIPLARNLRAGRDAAFLCISTWVALAIVLNPLAVRVIESAHGHSVLFRLLLVVPHFAVLGWWMVWGIRRWRGDGGGSRGGPRAARSGPRLAACVVILSLIAAGAWHVREAARRGGGPMRQAEAWHELPAVQRALAELDRIEPGPRVVVTDPITSYLVPAHSRHFAIAPFGQHSSPADERTVERIQDARAILNPLVSAGETVRLLRKYDASFVLLYHGFRHRQFFYYAPVDPAVFPAQREKFRGSPDLFAPVYDRDDVEIYRFVDPGPGWVDADSLVHPFVVLTREEAEAAARPELAARLGATAWTGPVVGGLELIGISFDEGSSARPGEPLTIQSYWRRTADPYVLPVAAFVRLETRYPSERFHHPFWGRAYRTWTERRRGEAYRFGRDIEPLAGDYPAFLWEPGAVYRAPLTLPVQPNAVPGEYVVRVLVREIPFEPNLRLRDLFTLRDSNDGLPMGKAIVRGTGER